MGAAKSRSVVDVHSITHQPEIFAAASHCVWDKVQGFKFLGRFGSPKWPIPSLWADLHQVHLPCIFSQGPHSHTFMVVPLLGIPSLNWLTPNLSPELTTSGRPSRLKRGEQPSLVREIRMSAPRKAGIEQIHYFTARNWNKNGDVSFLISLLSSLKIVTLCSWSNIQDRIGKSKSPTSSWLQLSLKHPLLSVSWVVFQECSTCTQVYRSQSERGKARPWNPHNSSRTWETHSLLGKVNQYQPVSWYHGAVCGNLYGPHSRPLRARIQVQAWADFICHHYP